MRKSCLECTLKHLASAEAAEMEFLLGYPSHYRLVIGQLDHAATECFAAYPELAWTIREHRLAWSKHPATWEVPYEALCNLLMLCMRIEDAATMPEVPEDCLAGLPKDDNGKPVYSMDTRA